MENAKDLHCLDLDPTKFDVIADLGSVFHLNVSNVETALFLNAGSLAKGKCVTAHVPGFRFVATQPKLASCPLVVNLAGGAEDFVALAFKASGDSIYIVGLSVTDLREWSPPTKGDESEEAVLRCINLNHPSLIGAVELVNTETVKLKDLAEGLLAKLPSFNRNGAKRTTTLEGLEKWVNRDYTENIRDVIKGAELRDRAASKGKGAAAGKGGQMLSAAGGKDALYKWAEQLKMMLTLGKYYDYPFDERFILISTPGDVETVKLFLKCAAVRVRAPARLGFGSGPVCWRGSHPCRRCGVLLSPPSGLSCTMYLVPCTLYLVPLQGSRARERAALRPGPVREGGREPRERGERQHPLPRPRASRQGGHGGGRGRPQLPRQARARCAPALCAGRGCRLASHCQCHCC